MAELPRSGHGRRALMLLPTRQALLELLYSEPEYVKLTDLARATDIPIHTLRSWVKSEAMGSIRPVGREYWVLKAEVIRFFDIRPEELLAVGESDDDSED